MCFSQMKINEIDCLFWIESEYITFIMSQIEKTVSERYVDFLDSSDTIYEQMLSIIRNWTTVSVTIFCYFNLKIIGYCSPPPPTFRPCIIPDMYYWEKSIGYNLLNPCLLTVLLSIPLINYPVTEVWLWFQWLQVFVFLH